MKNNRKKQTSSYLLIFLGIVAALLILIILYLTFFRKDSQSSINLTKNDSATDQTEDFTDGETFGFTSGDETSDDADQSGFILMMEVPTAKLLLMILLSRDLPREKMQVLYSLLQLRRK